MAELTTTAEESAQAFIARCLDSGDTRAEIVAALQEFYGASRATAYRWISAAMAGTEEPVAAAIARDDAGTIDLKAEAERQYAAAVAADDSVAALRWFGILQRLIQ